jgi:hypothetical protein
VTPRYAQPLETGFLDGKPCLLWHNVYFTSIVHNCCIVFLASHSLFVAHSRFVHSFVTLPAQLSRSLPCRTFLALFSCPDPPALARAPCSNVSLPSIQTSSGSAYPVYISPCAISHIKLRHMIPHRHDALAPSRRKAWRALLLCHTRGLHQARERRRIHRTRRVFRQLLRDIFHDCQGSVRRGSSVHP